MKPPMEEFEEYPPFAGFPKEGLAFLRSLKRNNNREWFNAHKDRFEETVKLPMQSLIVSLRPHFERFAPDMEVHPKRSLFRIYRDTRFSKDKTPYKTHAAAHFILRGTSKGLVGCGYYVHIEPGECFVGAGIYMPDGQQLKKIRKGISRRGKEFLGILRSKTFARRFGSIQGERLVRMPKGFSEDDPMAEWLKLKQFFVGASLSPQGAHTPRFLRTTTSHFETAAPFVQFLNSTM